MNEKPPREGARWGDDPVPEPTPEPATPHVPPEYVQLCDDYSEQNVQSALAIIEKTKIHFPHISALKRDPLKIVGEILISAKNSMEAAAADGRVHSLPATLKITEDLLGKTLAENPNITDLSTLIYTFGDEGAGKSATHAKKEREKKWDYWGFGFPAMIGFVTWSKTGSFGTGAGVAIGLIVVALILYGIFVGFEQD